MSCSRSRVRNRIYLCACMFYQTLLFLHIKKYLYNLHFKKPFYQFTIHGLSKISHKRRNKMILSQTKTDEHCFFLFLKSRKHISYVSWMITSPPTDSFCTWFNPKYGTFYPFPLSFLHVFFVYLHTHNSKYWLSLSGYSHE